MTQIRERDRHEFLRIDRERMTPEQLESFGEYMDDIIPHRGMVRGSAFHNLPQMLETCDLAQLSDDYPLCKATQDYLSIYLDDLLRGEHTHAADKRHELLSIVSSILEALAYQEARLITATGGTSYFENTEPLEILSPSYKRENDKGSKSMEIDKISKIIIAEVTRVLIANGLPEGNQIDTHGMEKQPVEDSKDARYIEIFNTDYIEISPAICTGLALQGIVKVWDSADSMTPYAVNIRSHYLVPLGGERDMHYWSMEGVIYADGKLVITTHDRSEIKINNQLRRDKHEL